mgnify:CR=1 FL=1
MPCQFEIVIPLLYIKDTPLLDAFPFGNEFIPLISAVHLLSLSTVLVITSSEMILLSVGLSTSSNNLRPIESLSILTYGQYLRV